MLSEHDEIEAKMEARTVQIREFCRFINERSDMTIEKYEKVESPDYYFKNGPNVVRLRGNPHELTVKRRKSTSSTRDRLEVDLRLSHRTKPEDTEAFLRAAGFTLALTLVKEAHIFWVSLSKSLRATFVIYEVWREEDPGNHQRFIEVEAEKGSEVTPETAKRYLRAWITILRERFKLDEPVNDSLWEIFSGERYQTVD